jgi:hypothetical protein
MCEEGTCRPFKLADIPHESVRTIGLGPDHVLVASEGTAKTAIYTVAKKTGAVRLTRPARLDGSYSVRLFGTRSTIVSADAFAPSNPFYYLSHCQLADCSVTVPAIGSYTFDGIRDVAFDPLRGHVFWFDPTTHELTFTNPDSWAPSSLGPSSAVTGQGDNPVAVTAIGGRVYGAFNFTIVGVREDNAAPPTVISAIPDMENVVDLAASPESLVILAFSGAVYKVPIPTGIGNQFPDRLGGITGVSAIATFGSTLFWSGNSTIYKCSLPLCAQPLPIAQDAALVRDIVADEQALYWLSDPNVDDATGTVMRLAH